MKRLFVYFIPLTVILSISGGSVQAALPKVGAACTKVGTISVSGGYKVTCLKVKTKLVWGQRVAVAIKTPTPTPAPTPTPTPAPTPTPTVEKVTFITEKKGWGISDAPIPASSYANVANLAASALFADLPPANPSVTADAQYESTVPDIVKNNFNEEISYVTSKYSGYLAAGGRFDLVAYATMAWGTSTAKALEPNNPDLAGDLLRTMPRFGENPLCANGLPFAGGGYSISYLKNPTLMLPEMNCADGNTKAAVVAHEFTHAIQSQGLKSLNLQDPNPAAWGPAWLREGQPQAAGAILSYWGGTSRTAQVLKNMLQGMADPKSKPNYLQYLESNDPTTNQEYPIGLATSNYLIARSGWTKSLQVWTLAASLAKDLRANEANRMPNFAQAFKTIYGQSLADFYTEVEPYLEWQYANR